MYYFIIKLILFARKVLTLESFYLPTQIQRETEKKTKNNLKTKISTKNRCFIIKKNRFHCNKRIFRLTKSLFVRIISFILKMDSKGGKQFHL